MLDVKGFLSAISSLEDAGIPKEVTLNALKESFESIIKKKNYEDSVVKVDILPEEGRIDIFNIKKVVEDVEDDNLEISLEDALLVDPNTKVGEEIALRIEVDSFSKADAIKFQSIFKQKIKEAEKAQTYAQFIDKKGELITGYVEKIEQRYTILSINSKTSVSLADNHKIGDETFTIGQPVRLYLAEVNSSSSGPHLFVSRSDPGFLRRLFEEEIHDIYDGTVVIKDIAREAGERSKISVYSNDPNVDPIGSCIGQGGMKIQKICSQLNHEKIDIVAYHRHPGLFIAEALKPAQVVGVEINEKEHSAIAVVNNGDLRVAIGKKGVNARLTVKLTGWKVDIKELDDALASNIHYKTIDNMEIEEKLMIFDEQLKAKEQKIEVIEEKEQVQGAENEEAVAPEVEDFAVVEEEQESEEEAPSEKIEQQNEEEKPFVLKPVQPSFSLADLEKEIEEEKKRKNSQTPRNFKKNTKKEEPVEEKPEEVVKKVDPSKYMDIYTEDELKAMEEEEEEESFYEDDEIDYDEFADFYEDDKVTNRKR